MRKILFSIYFAFLFIMFLTSCQKDNTLLSSPQLIESVSESDDYMLKGAFRDKKDGYNDALLLEYFKEDIEITRELSPDIPLIIEYIDFDFNDDGYTDKFVVLSGNIAFTTSHGNANFILINDGDDNFRDIFPITMFIEDVNIFKHKTGGVYDLEFVMINDTIRYVYNAKKDIYECNAEEYTQCEESIEQDTDVMVYEQSISNEATIIEITTVGDKPTNENNEIYEIVSEGSFYQILIAVDRFGNASVVESDIRKILRFQNGYLVGYVPADPVVGYGSSLASFDLKEKQTYYSDLMTFGVENIRFLENDIIAITGYHQDGRNNLQGSHRLVLMDNYCTPLPMQLQFDYGGDGIDLDFGDKYLILDIAYRLDDGTYIVVFAENPYYKSGSTEEPDNSVCELNMALFDNEGQQIEQFVLKGIKHPLNTRQMKNYPYLPELHLLNDETAIIIPQASVSRAFSIYPDPLEGYSTEPILVNLKEQTFTRWTNEEMREFLDKSSEFYGGKKKIYDYWQVYKTPHYSNFVISYTDNLLLFKHKSSDITLFALPSDFHITHSHEFDEMTYLVFNHSPITIND